MVKSVGIDLAGTGEHKVRCLDERAQLCDGFGFQTTPDGLAKLEERVFSDGSNPVIIFEPTGLAWVRDIRIPEGAAPRLSPGKGSVTQGGWPSQVSSPLIQERQD